MEYRMLGPLEVQQGDWSLPLGGAKQRALLALLVLNANHVVARDRLIDELWGDAPPATAVTTLHVYVSRLRKLLGKDALMTRGTGYVLAANPDAIDLQRFARLADEGREALAGGDATRAARALRDALDLWRGPALAEFEERFAQLEAKRLEDLHRAAVEERIEADLALGRHAEVIGELEVLIAEHPLRERPRGQLMLALYRSGRQAEALAAYREARSALSELGIEPGDHLRELERAILVQDAILTPARRKTNLPVESTPLVGRARELAVVLELVRANRLVTLTGVGGAGKTLLAMEAARQMVDEFSDGVWFVSLASLTEPALVEATIMETLGVRHELRDFLRAKHLLLVLDNLEQLLPEVAATVARLGAKVLATSRERLKLSAEHEYPVPTLPLEDAVALFTQRARQVSPHFEPDEYAAQVAHRLDGIPLALELAAPRVKVLTAMQIVEQLGSSLDLLSDGGRDRPERQRTLRAAVGWSYELLNVDEKRLFARLAVFAGGSDLAAADHVAEATLDSLQSLVDKSLVDQSEGRFVMHETLRAYALERLAEAGEVEELRRRHAVWFLSLAETDRPAGAHGGEPIRVLRAELDNFRAAIAFLQTTGATELELRLAIALYDLWIVGGYASEGLRAVRAALAGDFDYPSDLRARALRAAGDLALDKADYPLANELLEQALAVYRELEDHRLTAACLSDLGHVAKCTRDTGRAQSLYEESIELARALDDERPLAEALLNHGDLLVSIGEFARAEAECRTSLAVYEALGDTLGVATCEFSLALACLRQARNWEAVRLLKKALPVFVDFEYAVGIACSLEGLAAYAALHGHGRNAGRILGAAEILLEDAGASLEPAEQDLHDRSIDTLRTSLGEATLADLIAGGRVMPLAEVVQCALTLDERIDALNAECRP